MSKATVSQMLFDEPPLLVRPHLAATIGLNEAIILQQIHYWITEKEKRRDIRYQIDGRWWCYNTIKDWQHTFYFWSSNTVERTLKSLRDQGLVITAHHSRRKADRTLWYTVDYDALARLELKERPKAEDTDPSTWDEPFPQNGETISPKWGNGDPKMGKSIISPKWGNDLTKNKNNNKENKQRVGRGRNSEKSDSNHPDEPASDHDKLVAAVESLMTYWTQLTGRRPPRGNDTQLEDDWVVPLNDLLILVDWNVDRAKELLRDTRQDMLNRKLTPLRPSAVVPVIRGKLEAVVTTSTNGRTNSQQIPVPQAVDVGPVIWSQ